MCSLSRNLIGSEGAAALAPALANGALTRIDVRNINIEGKGAEQLSAAVLGNLKIEMFNEIPIKQMRADSFTELDLKGKGFGVVGGMVVAGLIPVMGALTRVDVRHNNIAGDSAVQLAAAVLGNLKIEKFNEIPIKEMRANSFTELDLKGKGTWPIGVEGGMVVAGLIPAMGALTSLDLSNNALCGVWSKGGTVSGTYTEEGITAIAEALRVNGALTRVDVRLNNIAGVGAARLAAAVLGNLMIEMFNEIPIKEMRANSFTELDLNGKGVGVEGGMVVAGLMAVMSGLTKLSLAQNELGEEGTKFLCDAFVGNNTLKELDISGSYRSNIGGTAGAKHVANMLLVNGSLTEVLAF